MCRLTSIHFQTPSPTRSSSTSFCPSSDVHALLVEDDLDRFSMHGPHIDRRSLDALQARICGHFT